MAGDERDLPREPEEREPIHRPWLAAILTGGAGAAVAVAVAGLPREGTPLPAIAREALRIALPRWHITEPVNEIVYGTRGFDTFGETFLLLAAVVSVLVLTRGREPRTGFVGESEAGRREQDEIDPRQVATDDRERLAREAERREIPDEGEPPPDHGDPDGDPLGSREPERAEAMTVVVRTAVRVVAPALAIAGLYLVAWGFAPGGGFPAGAVVVGVVLLLYAGFGHRRIRAVVGAETLELIELLGAIAIVVTGLLGFLLRGSFLAQFLPLGPPRTIRSGGILQVFSFGELFEVSTGLALAIFGLLGMRHDWSPDLDEVDGGRSA